MDKLNILTFNVRIDDVQDPWRWSERKEWVAKIINQYQPDIVGTQEVRPNMAESLNEALSDSYFNSGVARSEGKDAEITMIYVKRDKFEKVDCGSFMLSDTPDEYGSISWDSTYERNCSWIELKSKGSTPSHFRFFNTHLDHEGVEARIKGCEVLISKLTEQGNSSQLPFILTGDFNATPETGYLSPLLENEMIKNSYNSLLKTAEDTSQLATFNKFNGNTKGSPIDHIFVGHPFDILRTQIIRDTVKGRYASDHYPVLSEVAFYGKQGN